MHQPPKLIITGGIWRVPGIDDEPVIRLECWQVFEVDDGGANQHLVGWNAAGREGRVSSKLEAFDAAKRLGRTRSGRLYELCGPPGQNADALYVWESWLPEGMEAREVTQGFVQRNEEANP